MDCFFSQISFMQMKNIFLNITNLFSNLSNKCSLLTQRRSAQKIILIFHFTNIFRLKCIQLLFCLYKICCKDLLRKKTKQQSFLNHCSKKTKSFQQQQNIKELVCPVFWQMTSEVFIQVFKEPNCCSVGNLNIQYNFNQSSKIIWKCNQKI